MIMRYHDEVLNGGRAQFFDNSGGCKKIFNNKERHWDFEKVTTLFKKFLPKEEYLNYLKILAYTKDNRDCEKLNYELERLAKK